MEANKNKLISIIVDDTVDVGMLVWSLYTLTQQPKYYYLGYEHWFDISDAVGEDANGFLNIRVEVDGVKSIGELTESIGTLNGATEHSGIHILVARLHEKYTSNELYSELINASDKVIVLSSFGTPNIYKTLISGNNIDEFLSEYFDKGKEDWEDVSSLPWDRREYIALNFRPYSTINTANKVDLTNEKIYPFNVTNYYLNLQQHLPSMCNFIGIPVAEIPDATWEHISNIYTKWRTFRAEPVLWEMNLPIIVDSIVNGYNMDLTPYKLDIIKESVILHELLYKHNKNIRGYGLITLPLNTKDIHALLEDNFHTLTKY